MSKLEETIEKAFDMNAEELKSELPSILDKLEENIYEILENKRELLPKLFDKLEGLDVSYLAEKNPEAVDRFQEFLWDTIEILVQQDEMIKDKIKSDTTVNFRAIDSPMEGHLSVNAQERNVHGEANTIDDPDLTITADTNSLIDLLTGKIDVVQGVLEGEYELEGPRSKAMELAPIMKAMTDRFREF